MDGRNVCRSSRQGFISAHVMRSLAMLGQYDCTLHLRQLCYVEEWKTFEEDKNYSKGSWEKRRIFSIPWLQQSSAHKTSWELLASIPHMKRDSNWIVGIFRPQEKEFFMGWNWHKGCDDGFANWNFWFSFFQRRKKIHFINLTIMQNRTFYMIKICIHYIDWLLEIKKKCSIHDSWKLGVFQTGY